MENLISFLLQKTTDDMHEFLTMKWKDIDRPDSSEKQQVQNGS